MRKRGGVTDASTWLTGAVSPGQFAYFPIDKSMDSGIGSSDELVQRPGRSNWK